MKNKKLIFKQKPMSFEKLSETMQGTTARDTFGESFAETTVRAEIVKFREMLEQRIESKSPALAVIPEDHRPLIAKFVHERCAPEIIRSNPVELNIFTPRIHP